MRWVVGGKAAQGCAASPSQMGRFETQWLATKVNLSSLTDLSGHWIDLVHSRRPPHGFERQPDRVWNGRPGTLRAACRQCAQRRRLGGRAQAGHPAVSRGLAHLFSGRCRLRHAGLYEYLEAEHIKYAIRLPANQVLQGRIGYLLKRPVGRPPNEVRRFHANFTYQAASWSKPRRVIAKVEWHSGRALSPGRLHPPQVQGPSGKSRLY